MVIPLLDNRGRPTGQVLEREQFHRFPIPQSEERRVHPAAHTIIYDPDGWVLAQLRAKEKKFLPDTWIVMHGGHIDKRDLHRENGHYVLGFKMGAVRELREELHIVVPKNHLRVLDERVNDFSDISGFENKPFLKVYKLRYHPTVHGEIVPNPSEAQDAKFIEPTHDKIYRMMKVLGEPYASEVTEKIIEESLKIEYQKPKKR